MVRYSTFLPLLLVLGPVIAQPTPTLTNAGTTLSVSSGTALYVAGGVQNASGATLANAGTLQLTGDLTNAGTLTSTGTLLFNGSIDQTFIPGTASVTALTVNNLGSLNSNRLFISADLTVTGTLTLTKGLIRTQGSSSSSSLATLSLPASGSVVGEAAGQYVQGRLAVTRASVNAGAVDFTSGALLNPNGQNLGQVTITRTAGLQQSGVSYGTNMGGTTKGIDRMWQVAAAQQPSAATPASITLTWVSDDDNGFSTATPAQLWRADQAAGPWVTQDAPASASTRSFTANVTQLGTLTVSNTSAPLPVTLVNFTAQRQGADGLLSWTTASELHNDHFVVESSADGRTFRALGLVAGHGTTTQAQHYQFTDVNLARYATDVIYYRLRQLDTDGTEHYSPVRLVAVPATTLAVFPNPTSATATLTGAAPSTSVQVLDALGRVVFTTTTTSTGTATLALPVGLPIGVYVVRAAGQATRLTVD